MEIRGDIAAVYVTALNRPSERVVCICVRQGDQWFLGSESSGALWASGPEGYPYKGIGVMAVEPPFDAEAVRLAYRDSTTRDVLVEEGVALLFDCDVAADAWNPEVEAYKRQGRWDPWSELDTDLGL